MIVQCAECREPFEKSEARIKGSLTGNHFCCRSHSASFNNRLHPKRQLEHKCIICSNPTQRTAKWCKECRAKKLHLKTQKKSAHVVSHRKRYKQYFTNLKGGACQACGYNKCLRALHFHHLDPSKKEFNLAVLIQQNKRKEVVKEELEKCILLCANCHAEEHERLGSPDNPLSTDH